MEISLWYNDDSLASKTVEMLIENNLTISAAESLTAGLFQSELAEIPGNGSKHWLVGLITYTEDVKINQLGISRIIDKYGVVSSECAAAMAVK